MMHSNLQSQVAQEAHMDMPRELDKATLTDYRVEPPDILLIEAVNTVRRPDAPLEAGDTILIRLQNGLPLDPQTDPDVDATQHQLELQLEFEYKSINGIYTINPDATVDLGPAYGSVGVAGLTLKQAEAEILNYLTNVVGLKNPSVSVTLPSLGGKQVISGEHLVRPDGNVSLGIYGQVYVTGLTLPEVKAHIEAHLTQFVTQPQVNVDVLSYNSKVYYIVTDGGGFGEQVNRFPYTGNETVLDAVSNIQGLSEVSSKKIWIARPAPSSAGVAQILDVHWSEITSEGITATNYQIFPGDRIYIRADHLIATDNFLSKLLAPVERVFGIILLGAGVSRSIDFYDQQGQNGSF